jgi:Protein of unknown function (DUF1353)
MKRRSRRRIAASNHGRFSGQPQTLWLTEPSTDRRMTLVQAFSFWDPMNKEWRAPASYVVDGASIPRALWAVVGSPYTGDYRRASIVHDTACDEAGDDAKARRAADRMFYHACRAGGCSIIEATLLYIGVRIGAWANTVAVWRAASSLDGTGPRYTRSAAERRLELDFSLAAELVLKQRTSDQVGIIERRVDAALSEVSGVNLAVGRSRRR